MEQLHQISVDLSQTNEKFRIEAEQISSLLINMLQQLIILENEAVVQHQQMEEEKKAMGIPPSTEHPKYAEFWAHYRQKRGDYCKPFCTESLFAKSYQTSSIANPPEYGFVETGCRMAVMMKSAAKATVECVYTRSITMKKKFVFKKVETQWKLNEVYYGFDDESWHQDKL